MEYFLVRYDSRVVIYEHKTFIRLATEIVGNQYHGDLYSRKLSLVSVKAVGCS